MPFDDTMFLKQNVDVLSFFSEEMLRLITVDIKRASYNSGQILMFQGEISNNFHVIKTGSVAVWVKSGKEKIKVADLKAGDFFGEMSLLEPSAASATIKALEDNTEVLEIPHNSFQYLLKQNPLLEKTLRERIATRKQHKTDAVTKKDPPPAS